MLIDIDTESRLLFRSLLFSIKNNGGITMKNYVVIGLVASGADYKEEQIIEAAVIKYDENFKEIGSFHSLVCYNRGKAKPLSDYVKKLTGIKESDLTNGMTEKEAMLLFSNFIDNDSIVVAQYAPFDFGFLAKYEIYPNKYICMMSLIAQVEPAISSSFVPIYKSLDIQLEKLHKELADIQATARLLKYSIQQDIQYTENYIVKFTGRSMNFIPANTIQVLDELRFYS